MRSVIAVLPPAAVAVAIAPMPTTASTVTTSVQVVDRMLRIFVHSDRSSPSTL